MEDFFGCFYFCEKGSKLLVESEGGKEILKDWEREGVKRFFRKVGFRKMFLSG